MFPELEHLQLGRGDVRYLKTLICACVVSPVSRLAAGQSALGRDRMSAGTAFHVADIGIVHRGIPQRLRVVRARASGADMHGVQKWQV
ncbi:hypothetical protein CVO74_12040 [Xanthomonas prunicola]|uniref:Uncharacterized protein n=1 Tax=Xanthomonas prunicola TaxID=2053930 RepID=A0A2N3RK39_9XANT|nr:hypothetical protein XpruCFBP8353_13465 [Xanthomonas prunicola]PKV17148.1 hypothetical protein XpruCFBP8354_13470 [Xanthomonas prunicola]PKV20440.1 hypothetical protein CVO74_12040 [Xanthomonas prunicola]